MKIEDIEKQLKFSTPTYDDIEWAGDAYTAWENPKNSRIEASLSFETSKPILGKNHTSQDALLYAQELKEYELREKNQRTLLTKVKKYNDKIDEVLAEYVEKKSGLDRFSDEAQEEIIKYVNKNISDGEKYQLAVYEFLTNGLIDLIDYFARNIGTSFVEEKLDPELKQIIESVNEK